MSIVNIYESGRTVRYHCNPDFSGFGQTVADHTWGCLALLLALHPNPSLNLIKAVTYHDSGERWCGDIPYPFKVENPEAWAKFDHFEKEKAAQMGIPQVELTSEEKEWLEAVDKYEAVLFAKRSRPDIFYHKTPGFNWLMQEETCKQRFARLGVEV